MTYERFEQLPVWQAGMTLTERTFKPTEDKGFHYKGDLRNQFLRAALSVPNNVAEGFERGTTQERLSYFAHLNSPAESVSRQLRGGRRLFWRS